MMVAFDFLSEPINISHSRISVLCIENKALFRKIINSLYHDTTGENKIIFSDDFVPVDFKFVCFISDYFKLDVTSSFTKKMYDDISLFCHNEFQNDVARLYSEIENLFGKIIDEYDYDFSFCDDYSLPMLFKALDLKPDFESNFLLENLIQYILIIHKYSKIKCFVLANLHQYFTEDELKEFYKELYYNKISAFVIENSKQFITAECEDVVIVDSDLCEIS